MLPSWPSITILGSTYLSSKNFLGVYFLYNPNFVGVCGIKLNPVETYSLISIRSPSTNGFIMFTKPKVESNS